VYVPTQMTVEVPPGASYMLPAHAIGHYQLVSVADATGQQVRPFAYPRPDTTSRPRLKPYISTPGACV
jgi:hypothetical protein